MKARTTSGKGAKSVPIQWARTTRFKVPIPKDEPDRLIDLHQFAILDTLPEAEFDHIALLASQICQTPIAVISLVDSDRQWFKSKVGLSFSETSRDVAFCAHAIMQHDLFIVSDASKDKRFVDNPLVCAEPKLRFYAGAPLISADDHALGTLCVMDKVPRELSDGQKEALRTLSQAVMRQLESRRRIRELEGRLRDVNHETQFLKKSTKEARSASRTRCKFLAKAAHEVNATAREIASVIERARSKPSPSEQGDLLAAARSSANSLIDLAKEMKKVAKAAGE